MNDHERTHFIGIGGAGMSALAAVMRGRGAEVSGSDQKESDSTRRLRTMGIRVEIGHVAGNIGDPELVVISAAIPPDNPEIAAAKERGIPVIQRAEMLGRLMDSYGSRIAIAGTHGKTTTTSMVSLIALGAGLDPTILIGGDVKAIGGNARLGEGDLFITEACEAYSSFLYLHPSIAVVTNVDADHLEHHGTLENIKQVFVQFLSQVDEDGCVIACADDENVRSILPFVTRRIVLYGVASDAEVRADEVDVDSPAASYSLVRNGKAMGRVQLATPGLQNVLNSLAAAAVGLELGTEFPAIREALGKHRGAGRRFEILGEARGVLVVDDYAHHPAEIAATLTAARRGFGRRIVAIFQPHLYSRTKFFLRDFAESLKLADRQIVTDIYAARERPIAGVSAEQIVNAMNRNGNKVGEYIPDKANIAEIVLPELRSGDMVIVMGAGDIRGVGEEILSRLSGTAGGAG
ncbi:MAG: UDP-N-acetylmuramate--L-alanine ligase [Armatimonadota bacterium]|nr:UDP-N-acetylmuramate--L-alanine ligase [Armatimonadota bacterium]